MAIPRTVQYVHVKTHLSCPITLTQSLLCLTCTPQRLQYSLTSLTIPSPDTVYRNINYPIKRLLPFRKGQVKVRDDLHFYSNYPSRDGRHLAIYQFTENIRCMSTSRKQCRRTYLILYRQTERYLQQLLIRARLP